ncbi:hypothetical protein MP228_009534 [Amoeboaphelidium protococcarum]|nr:hypothetical protein MP228_009534 [Amoeboaphelidium protococcarum]
MSKAVKVRVPASSANIGCAFDTAGIALNLFLTVEVSTVTTATGCLIECSGTESAGISHVGDNLILQAFLYLYSRVALKQADLWTGGKYSVNILPSGLRMKIENQIPLSRGLGSSASAIVAGMMACNEIYNLKLDRYTLFDYILEVESHPDNVGASLFGGLVIGYNRSEEERQQTSNIGTLRHRCGFQKLSWNSNIKLVVVIPEYQLSTSEARRVLPQFYSRADTVQNLQRMAIFVAMLSRKEHSSIDRDLALDMYELLKDKIHQPYRSPLVPGLTDMLSNMNPINTPGLIGIVLSGAGPSILALCYDNFEDAIGSKMVDIVQSQDASKFGGASGIKARFVKLQAVDEGAVVLHDD